MRIRSKLAAVVGVMVGSTWLVASAVPASAAGPCGSGYTRIGVYNIPATGTKKGTLEVYYNSGSGKNCALAYGSGANYGTTTYKAVGIALPTSDGWADYEADDFKYYAGPVYVTAKGKCIDLVGAVGTAVRYATNVHCG
ncbi:hypothetical protein ABGB18_13130 [Nonomuraea sp. B12E4]|uniref:hypothetical protein n=1 Tax=Nonomuraea sp. B12E4 TaxID=3153564 RepID=UPI00325CCE30